MSRPAQPPRTRRRTLIAALALAGLSAGACLPEPTPSTPQGRFADPPVVRPPPPIEAPEPEADPPPGPWPADPPPVSDPGPPHPLDPTPLPAPWPVGEAVVGVDFERTVVADERVVGLVATDRGVSAATASGGLFELRTPGGFEPVPTALPPLRGFIGEQSVRVACPADGAPARVDLGAGWARLDVGCNPGGRHTVATDKAHGYLLAGGELRDGAWPALERRRPAPVPEPRVVGAGEGRAIVVGRAAIAASEDAGGTFIDGARPEPVVLEPRAVAVTGKGRAVLVGRSAPGRAAIEYSRDGGRTWRAALGPDRGADDLAGVVVDARGIFFAAPREPGAALRSDDGGRSWRPIDRRIPVGGALLAADRGALVGTPRGLVAGLDRDPPRGPGLDRPLWRATFTHPRVGVGVGVLGGIWRTTDGGRRWHLVPGTAGLPFTDLDRLGGHRLMAVGAGLFRRSDDAGARWTAQPPPGSCEATWVRFTGERGLADCGDGRPALSVDGGATWDRVEAAPARGPAVWLDHQRAATLAADGRVGWSRDGAAHFVWAAPPTPFVELAPAPEGVSAIDVEGRIWRSAGPDGAWQPGPRVTTPRPPVTHHPLADGRTLLATAEALYVADPDGAARRLGPTPEARALALTGDGAVLVLQATATTRFDPR